ncbi:holin [Clostridium aestuarii]|uniref:Holin n=1 Tax=Clostridium aestuarii TaxID=338193 RepID=A0ABT4CYG5_9CLOT|nr:holin [Clostridium aestuarii]MCY6484014.1 holin [Clostridium aestuarii]
MEKFKNYGLWVSIFAFIPMVLEAFGLDILPGNYDQLVNAFLTILVLAGIISNPEKGKGYLDDKNKEFKR